jgi:hypothetical protein
MKNTVFTVQAVILKPYKYIDVPIEAFKVMCFSGKPFVSVLSVHLLERVYGSIK